MSPVDITPFGLLLRKYAFAYTAAHDFEVCRSLMVDDYTLHMGDHTLQGRDDVYIPATQRQYRQYPGLGFTVHDLISNGERAALRFTEHGKSVLKNAYSAWRGISLYRWNGENLTECRVEQDYCSRTMQTNDNVPHVVPAPAHDPWVGDYDPELPHVTNRVSAYLRSAEWLTSHELVFDDEEYAEPRRAAMRDPAIKILDLFGAGQAVAFHARVEGIYEGGIPLPDAHAIGRPAILYASGIVRVDGSYIRGHVVTDRLSLLRRLTGPNAA